MTWIAISSTFINWLTQLGLLDSAEHILVNKICAAGFCKTSARLWLLPLWCSHTTFKPYTDKQSTFHLMYETTRHKDKKVTNETCDVHWKLPEVAAFVVAKSMSHFALPLLIVGPEKYYLFLCGRRTQDWWNRTVFSFIWNKIFYTKLIKVLFWEIIYHHVNAFNLRISNIRDFDT